MQDAVAHLLHLLCQLEDRCILLFQAPAQFFQKLIKRLSADIFLIPRIDAIARCRQTHRQRIRITARLITGRNRLIQCLKNRILISPQWM
mgnify:FL=1